MALLKIIFKFYINSSIHVSLAVVTLTVFTYVQSQTPIDYKLLVFIFLSSITGYNFVKYAPVAKLYHRSLTQQLRQIQIFSLVVFIGLGVCLFFINLKVILISTGLGLITLCYAIPLGRKNLREIAFLKVFVIALIWAVTTYVLPFINESFQWKNFTPFLNIQFFERILWVILLMIPFEIRDVKFDRTYLKTLVSTFGVVPIKLASVFILMLLAVHKLVFLSNGILLMYLGMYLSLGVAILFATTHQKPYYSSFYVEALPLLWLTLALIWKV